MTVDAANSVINYTFRNSGTKVSNFNASVFVHFEVQESKYGRNLGGDYEPFISTRKWEPGKTISDSRNVDFTGRSGAVFNVYAGLYYFADGRARVVLANPDMLSDRKIFLGTIRVK